MADNFTIKKTEKETETKKTITIDIERVNNASNTISGSIEEVVEKLKVHSEND